MTLSRNADRTAQTTLSTISSAVRLAAGELDRPDREPLEEPGPAQDPGQHHHPGQQEDDVEVDRPEGLFLVDDARATTTSDAAEQRGDGLVDPVGRDQARR